jgi:poly(hydroxyalkanoate) depolymerase family esterase
MSPFDSLAPAHDALWSLFTRGPVGLAAQFFIGLRTTAAASPAPEARPQPQPVTHQRAWDYSNKSNGKLPTVAPAAEGLVPKVGGAQRLSSRFEHDNITHHFKMYVLSGYNGQRLPMIVMLHGAQQDPDDFATGTEMHAAAEEAGYIVVYPEQSASANPLRYWNWFRPADRLRDSGKTAMVAALTREVMAIYNVDNARVYVAGMSAGGAMAVNRAVTHPDFFAASAIHSGVAFGVADEPLSALCAMTGGMGQIRLPETLSDGEHPRAVPLIVFHGDADDTVYSLNSDQLVAMSRLLLGDPGDTQPPTTTRVQNAENSHSYTRHVFHDHEGVPISEQWLVAQARSRVVGRTHCRVPYRHSRSARDQRNCPVLWPICARSLPDPPGDLSRPIRSSGPNCIGRVRHVPSRHLRSLP